MAERWDWMKLKLASKGTSRSAAQGFARYATAPMLRISMPAFRMSPTKMIAV